MARATGRHAAPPSRAVNRRTALLIGAAAVPVGAGLAWWLTSGGGAGGFEPGRTEPAPGTTGVPAGIALTTVDGDLTMSPGQTYENLDIHGFVHGAAGATLLNSRVRGRGTGFIAAGLVNGSDRTAGMRVSRCTLVPDVPRYFLNGFDGSHCLIDACDISGVCDGIHSTGDDTLVFGCYLHDFAFFDGSTGSDHADDPVHPGWAHLDGLQALGGRGLVFVGNTVRMYISRTAGTPDTALNGGYPDGNYGNGLTISPRSSRVSGFDISGNWFYGGDVAIQVVAGGSGFDTGNDGRIAGNRFALDQRPLANGRRVQMRSADGLGSYSGLSTNVFASTASVPPELRGKPLEAQAGSGTGTPGMSYSLPR